MTKKNNSFVSYVTIISIIFLIIFQIGCQESNNPVGVEDIVASKTETITPLTGGIIEITTENVGIIQLIVPPMAVSDTERITIQVLNKYLSNPFSNNIIPTIRILPDGLRLDSLVTLKLVLNNPVSDTSKTILYYLMKPDLALPLKTRWVNKSEVIGEIYHFSDYGGAVPTEQEIQSQAGSLINQFSCDVWNWQSFSQFISAMLEYIELAQLLGYDDLAQQLINQLEQRIIDQVNSFLDQPIPEEPCGYYINTLLKYSEMVFTMVNNEALVERCQNRISEVLNRCYIRGEIEFDYDYSYSDANGTIHRSHSGFVPFYVNTLSEPHGQVNGNGTVEWTGEEHAGECVGTEVLTGNVTLTGELEIDNQGIAWLNIQITETYSGSVTVVCPGGSRVLPMNPPTTETNVRFLMEDGAYVINPPPTPMTGYFKWILHLQHLPGKAYCFEND